MYTGTAGRGVLGERDCAASARIAEALRPTVRGASCALSVRVEKHVRSTEHTLANLRNPCNLHMRNLLDSCTQLLYPAYMKTLDASLAARNFRNLLDSTMLGESTLITRFGKPVAVIGPVEAQMDKPIAVAPTERPVARPLEVRNVTGLTADTVTGTSFTYAGPRSQAELDEARGISLEQQKAAQKKRDALLRGSRKEKA